MVSRLVFRLLPSFQATEKLVKLYAFDGRIHSNFFLLIIKSIHLYMHIPFLVCDINIWYMYLCWELQLCNVCLFVL